MPGNEGKAVLRFFALSYLLPPDLANVRMKQRVFMKITG
jgi:hypothetical protein